MDGKAALSRRRFLGSAAAMGAMTAVGSFPMPALARGGKPMVTHGLQSGDIAMDGGVIWARADRPSRMLLEVATSDSFQNAVKLRGPAAIGNADFTAKQVLSGLPAGEDIFYRVRFEDLADSNLISDPVTGHFRTAPAAKRDISFVWTGDTAGQGWGINEAWGGMRGYETMRKQRPDFLIHSGDNVYCDGPIQAEVQLDDGTVWKNLVTEEKSKVAETLAEFRGNYKYNLLDENVRRFNAEVPILTQWDDHEVVNNWYPGEMLTADDRYRVKSADLLAARSNRAFREFMPMRENSLEPGRIYRKISYGPSLDVFMLDMRSYRGPNGANNQADRTEETHFLGPQQLRWLKQELLASKATWKVIAADMPIGLIVYDNWREKNTFENGANGDGPVLGREHDIADLLRFIKHNNVANTVWFTADVHYTAAHYYDPNKAQFQDFEPFWEFVSGPIHAGSFGPGDMDNTFGPQVVYTKNPGGKPNLPPSAGLQFFGHVKIDGQTEVMTVTLKDIGDNDLYKVDLEPKMSL